MYLLPKIHKRLHDVPGRPVISNCGTPTEKVSEFLNYHLQSVMKLGKSYIKDTGDFLEKLKALGDIPPNAILVTADVVGLYPSIPHDAGLKALYEKLEERTEKKIPSVDLVEMAEFVLKNNFFEFETKIIQQLSVVSLLLPIRVYLLSHGSGYGILMMFSSSGPKVKKSLKGL